MLCCRQPLPRPRTGVDANYGNNEWDGSCKYADRDEGAKKGPKKWLSEAMMIPDLGENDVVHAAEGIYNEGEMWDGYNTNRVILAKAGLGLVADEGREVTFIEGAISSDHVSGNGAGAIRCVKITGSGAYVRGFTIRKGRTDVSPDGKNLWYYAGGCVNGGTVVDCVITNGNAGYRGAIGNSGKMYVIGCHVYGDVVKNAAGYTYTSYGPINYLNSIVHGSSANLLQTSGGVAVNSVFPEGSLSQYVAHYNCFIGSCTSYVANKPTEYHHCYCLNHPSAAHWDDCRQVTETEAKFEEGTYRPLRGSVLIDAGIDEHYLTNFPETVQTLWKDYAYGMRPRFRGVRIDIGAYEYGSLPSEMEEILTDNPAFALTDASSGTYADKSAVVIPAGNSLLAAWTLASGEVTANDFTITAAADEGATLNIYLDGAATPTWTVVAVDGERTISYRAGRHTLRFESVGGSAFVKAVATDVRTPYFVKPDGDDAADGKTFATARKTLKGAMEIPGLAAGDVVYVASGVYAAGEMWDGNCSNRVVIAAGVGLVGYEGADVTVIEGKFADTADKCGPEAVRCVCARAGAWVRGFTLRNGATAAVQSSTDESNVNYLNGGNAWANDGATFVDCVISNGVAKYRGGGVGSLYKPGGNYIRCFFRGNKAVEGTGTAACFGNFYDCVFDGGGVYGAYVTVVNSAFLSGASVRGGSDAKSAAQVYNSVLVNSDAGQSAYCRCLLGVSALASNSTKSDGTLLGQANLAAKLDADYRPLKDTNLVDFGDANHYLTNFPAAFLRFAGMDFAGGQRVYNGAIDAGAGEYDWRGDFAKKLARKGVAIPAADANVTTNALAGLDLPMGESTTVRYLPVADGDCSLALTGTAVVTLDGEALTPVSGVYSFAVEADKAYDLVVVAISDVTIESAGVPKRGMVLLLR